MQWHPSKVEAHTSSCISVYLQHTHTNTLIRTPKIIYHSIAGRFLPKHNAPNAMFLRLGMNTTVVWLRARFAKRYKRNNKSNLYWCSWNCIVMPFIWMVTLMPRAWQVISHGNAHLFWLNACNHFDRQYNLCTSCFLHRVWNREIDGVIKCRNSLSYCTNLKPLWWIIIIIIDRIVWMDWKFKDFFFLLQLI